MFRPMNAHSTREILFDLQEYSMSVLAGANDALGNEVRIWRRA